MVPYSFAILQAKRPAPAAIAGLSGPSQKAREGKLIDQIFKHREPMWLEPGPREEFAKG